MTTSIVLELVDRVTRPVRRVQQALSGLSQRAGLDRIAAASRRVRIATGEAVGQLRNLTQRMAMIGGVAVGAVWGMRRLVGGFTEPADAAIKLSRRLSMTHEQVQLLIGAAGRMSDMGDGQMASNLESFSNRLAEAALGLGEPAKAMEWAGIQLRDSQGNMRGSMDVMKDIADVMASTDSEEMQTRFARAMFGRGGVGMINVLQEGREGLEREMEAWGRTGQLISEEDAQEAERYNDNIGELDGTLRGLRNTVVAELVPALNEWLERLNPLIQANRELITERVLEGLQEFWAGLRRIGGVVSRAADVVGGFGRLLVGVAAIMSMGFVLAVGKAALALAGLSLVILTTPAGWFLLAVAAIAGAVYLIYRNWDGIVEWFGNLWGGIQAWFTQGIGGIMRDLASWHPAALFMRAIDAIFEAFGARPLSAIAGEWLSGVTDHVAALWVEVSERFSQGVAAATEWVSALWRGVQSWFSQGIGGIMRSLARWSPAGLVVQALDAIFEAFGARPLSAVVTEWFAGVTGRVAELWVSIGEWFDQGMADVLRSLARWSPMAVVVRAIDGIFRAFGARPLSAVVTEWFAGVRERVTALWADMQAWFSQGIGAVTRDVLSFNPAALLGRAIDEVFALFTGRPLSVVGAEWIDGLVGSVSEAWQALPDWADERLAALGEVFASFSLAEIGSGWVDSLRAGISERWEGLTGWLSAKMDGLTGWMPDWARDGLGIQATAPLQPGGSPQAALGAPVAEGRPSAMPAPARAEVGGELRIVVDSEGRPRVAEARRRGGMEFDVMSGGLGIMP
jgi:hypothetical protein